MSETLDCDYRVSKIEEKNIRSRTTVITRSQENGKGGETLDCDYRVSKEEDKKFSKTLDCDYRVSEEVQKNFRKRSTVITGYQK